MGPPGRIFSFADGKTGYITDSGTRGAIVVDLDTGDAYTGQIARNVADHGAKGKFSYRF